MAGKSRQVRAGIERAYKPMRIKVLRPIAKNFASQVLVRIEKAEKELFTLMKTAAERRGETPANYNQIRQEEFSSKDLTPTEAEVFIQQLTNFLTQEEINYLRSIFGSANEGILPIFERYIKEALQTAYNHAYELLKRHARSQDPSRFATVIQNLPINYDTPVIQGFLQDAFRRVTSKLTINHVGTVAREIIRGLESGRTWNQIASRIHRLVGTGIGGRYHWNRLVRTELMQAVGIAQRERYQDAGIQYESLSVASTACPICKSAKGIYRLGQGPPIPLHPNCRCSRIPYYSLPKGISIQNVRPVYRPG